MDTETAPTAVVVGGGIGGLTTALALQHVGWQVSVRERRDALDRGGAGLVLWPNAMRCLAALGVADAVRSRATPLTGSVVRRADGRVLSRVSTAARTASARPLGIVRADLVEALASALGPAVLRLGEAVTADTDAPAADLLVGADGVRSVVRTAMAPAVQPGYRGYTVWRALVPVSAHDLGGAAELSETWGAGMRFGMVPAGPGATYVYAAAAASQGGRSDDELTELRCRYADWHPPIADVLSVVEPGSVLRHDIFDLPPGRTPLHSGRRVLVGDAAHAMEPNLGQGAGLAIEDAVVLAHALSTRASIEEALADYAAARAARVTALARQSRKVGRLARLERRGAVGIRDLAMWATPDRLARRAVAAAADWRPPPITPSMGLPVAPTTHQETR